MHDLPADTARKGSPVGGRQAWRTPQAAEPPSDEDLLERFRTSGDEDAFAAMVRRYELELFNYLRRYLGNAEMAEDVFQATSCRSI